jgi:drug/metabolite transporter (DMT)-like permease
MTGLALALTAAALWGVLPIALEVVLQGLDPYTITWYRLGSAGVMLFLILAATGGLPKLPSLMRSVWMMLGFALLGLTGNYVLYVKAVAYTSPTVAQTVTQLGPMFLLFGGLVVLKEHFSRLQWIGFTLLIFGLVLFFNRRLPELIRGSGFGRGVVFLVIGALTWAVYGLVQKRLTIWMSPQQILLMIYLGAGLLLLPLTTPGDVRHLSNLQYGMLGFCCLNTLAAYGAFAEGLKRWEVSRFSAVLSTSPLFTVAGMWIVGKFAPTLVAPEHLNTLSVAGTLLVVVGSATCAMGRRLQI